MFYIQKWRDTTIIVSLNIEIKKKKNLKIDQSNPISW